MLRSKVSQAWPSVVKQCQVSNILVELTKIPSTTILPQESHVKCWTSATSCTLLAQNLSPLPISCRKEKLHSVSAEAVYDHGLLLHVTFNCRLIYCSLILLNVRLATTDIQQNEGFAFKLGQMRSTEQPIPCITWSSSSESIIGYTKGNKT